MMIVILKVVKGLPLLRCIFDEYCAYSVHTAYISSWEVERDKQEIENASLW